MGHKLRTRCDNRSIVSAAVLLIAAAVGGCSAGLEGSSKVGGPQTTASADDRYKPYQTSDFNSRPPASRYQPAPSWKSIGVEGTPPLPQPSSAAATGAQANATIASPDGRMRWQASPRGAEVAAPSAPAAPARGGAVIVVQQGDTLSSLARRYGVSLGALMTANGLTNSNLQIGQQLVLPKDAKPAA